MPDAVAAKVLPRKSLCPWLRRLGCRTVEEEMAQNSWLTVPARADILFELPPEGCVRRPPCKTLGISFAQLSDVAGHA